MATVEQRSDRFRLIFYFQGKRYAASLKTRQRRDAETAAAMVERTLMLIHQRILELPEGVDLVSFLLSGGKHEAKPKSPPIRTLGELTDRYLQAVAIGAMEDNSVATVKTHLDHIIKSIGASFPIQTLARSDLQQHVNGRARKKGHFKRPLSPVTLRKEVASFRACWNWGVEGALLTGRFPNRGLKFPKTTEKPPFQTWDEIERQLARGGLTATQEKETWDALYLTMPQIDEFLAFAEANAGHAFLFPMLMCAAHTGARRGELLLAQIDDLDFEGGTVLIREKKRVKGERSYRRVPLSAPLERVLRDWVTKHPGGQHLFCHRPDIIRSKKRRTEVAPLTRNEIHDHFSRLVAQSKWKVLRGWHIFRHSFISNCASKGVDQRMIDEWAGHQSEAMRRRYRHLIPSIQRQALCSVFFDAK